MRMLAVSIVTLAAVAVSAADRRSAPSAVVGEGPSMLAPRAAHSATLMRDGRVLVAGGCTVDSCESGPADASAEVFDPRLGRFLPAASMAGPRNGHGSWLLPDGRVMLAGGFSGADIVDTTEVYDPATGRFLPGPRMTSPRAGFTATPLPDGRMLVAGGSTGSRRFTATTEVFDPRAMRFSPGPEMTGARHSHAAVPLGAGEVLLAGGNDASGRVLRSAEVLDAVRGTRCAVGEMSVARYKLAAAALPDGGAIVVGGSDERDSRGRYATTEIFDPATARFRAGPMMHEARFKLTAGVALAGGRVVIAGGGPTVEIYGDGTLAPARGTVEQAWAFNTALPLQDGRVLIAGGYDEALAVTDRTWLLELGDAPGAPAPAQPPHVCDRPAPGEPAPPSTTVGRAPEASLSLVSPRLVRRGGRVWVKLRATAPVRDVAVRLAGRRLIAEVRRRRLAAGATRIALRLRTRRARGRAVLRVRARDGAGRPVRGAWRVRIL